MQGFMGRFRPDRVHTADNAPSSSSASSPLPGLASNGSSSASSSGRLFTFWAYSNPPSPPRGSFDYDIASQKYQTRWESWSEFETWLKTEQRDNAIELRLVNTYTKPAYVRKLRYVCSRGGTGGQKPYTKLHPDWEQKVEGKRTACKCSLTVKEYPGVSTVLGNYSTGHNHPTGNANLRFTQIPKETREYIAGLLRMKVMPEHILRLLHQGVYDADDLFENDFNAKPVAHRAEFIQLRDIRRIEKDIEAETVRLHSDDGLSTLQWVKNLRAKGHLLGFKSVSDPPPPGSGLERDVFTLMIQTGWQRHMFQKYGNDLLCIDATHNTTMYEKLNLTTLVVRDRWAHGIPVAWMLASSGTRSTIGYFLRLHRAQSPLTIPRNIMSDFDWPQINACLDEYLMCIIRILLCWWHVLHAWQKHLHIPTHPELWQLLKGWIRITDAGEFGATWAKIKTMAPPGFVDYLTRYWMTDRVVKMWSAVYRQDRTIFQLCDTNMLIEAWHHVLKGKFLLGKRNRRLDHLLSTLLTEVLPYYALKQRRQDFGFEGVDIEVKKRRDVIERSKIYVKEDIVHVEDGKYLVPSRSDPSRAYEVDIETYTCTCLDFPVICFCKHLCAVQSLFDESNHGTPSKAAAPVPGIPIPYVPGLDDSAVTSKEPDPSSKPRVLTVVAEKLERLAARLRQSHRKSSQFSSMADLEAILDAMLDSTNATSILPTAQCLRPNVKSWRQTQAVMMPAVKTGHKCVGDSAYGAGASSGSLAKKSKKAPPKDTSPPLLPSIPPFPPANAQMPSYVAPTAYPQASTSTSNYYYNYWPPTTYYVQPNSHI